MARNPDEGDAGQSTCVAAHPDSRGGVYTLVVTTDGESFVSSIYFHPVADQEGDAKPLYQTQNWVTALWLSPSESLYLVDEDGFLHTNEAGPWRQIDLHSPTGLLWTWGLDDVRVYAAGGDGAVWRRTAVGWEPFGDGVEGDVYCVHGVAEDDLYAVGANGGAFHHDGIRWRRIDLPTNADLHSVFAVARNEVYIGGVRGTFFVGAEDRWRVVEAPETDLFSFACFQTVLYTGLGGAGTWVFQDGELRPVKENVFAYRLAANESFLCTAGVNEIVRFDGNQWLARTFLTRIGR